MKTKPGLTEAATEPHRPYLRRTREGKEHKEMSTGDLSGNVERLRSVLREVKYTYANAMPEDRLVFFLEEALASLLVFFTHSSTSLSEINATCHTYTQALSRSSFF